MDMNDTDSPDNLQKKDPPPPNRFFTTMAARQGVKTSASPPPVHAHQDTTLLWAGDSARTTGSILTSDATSTLLTPGASPPSSRRRKKVSAYAADVGFDFEEDEEGDGEWEDADDSENEESPPSPSSLTKVIGRPPSSSSLNPTEILSTKELESLQSQRSRAVRKSKTAEEDTLSRPTLVLSLPSLELDLNEQAENKYDESATFHNGATTTTPPPPVTRPKQEELVLPEDGDFGVEGIIPEGSEEGEAASAHPKAILVADDDDLTDIMSTWGEATREENDEEEDWKKSDALQEADTQDDWGDHNFPPLMTFPREGQRLRILT